MHIKVKLKLIQFYTISKKTIFIEFKTNNRLTNNCDQHAINLIGSMIVKCFKRKCQV